MLDRLEPPTRFIHANSELFQGVLEALTDGIVILTAQGERIYENHQARRLCRQLNSGKTPPTIPVEIWQVCQSLIESHRLYPNRPIILESEATPNRLTSLRIRARWLALPEAQRPYLVVLLEDCYESVKGQTIRETQKYGLTPRQAEVWILHRLGYRYREIASELHIALDTVKKHVKDIHAKQRRFMDENPDRSD